MKYLAQLILLFGLLLQTLTAYATEKSGCAFHLEALSPEQQKLAYYIHKDWMDNVFAPEKHHSNPGIYSFLKDDPAVQKVNFALGAKFTGNYKTPFSYPENIWDFLRNAQDYLTEQEVNRPEIKNKKIIPGIVIQNVNSKKLHFVTKPSDIPNDAKNWTTLITGFLDQKDYYEAIDNGILPITINGSFSNGDPLKLEDHEWQHLLSIYHPDSFPGYMLQMKDMASLYLHNKVSSLTLFLFSEAFCFVRSDAGKKEKFEDFYGQWTSDAETFSDLKIQIEKMPASQLEIFAKRFLDMYPSLALYRGGLIRDSILIPASAYPDGFIENWKYARSNTFTNEEFSLQNWRNLYSYLVIAYNLTFKGNVDSFVSLSHMGLDFRSLNELIKKYSHFSKTKVLEYLKVGLTELLWAVHESYQLDMPADEVMNAAIHPKHPQHEKVKKYFESAFASVYAKDEKSKSVYYRTFLKQ